MFLANKLNKGAGSPAAPVDAQFNYVTMLLHGDGTNGAQNNTFLDGSTNNFTITRNGNTTQGSFSPYGDNWSNYFAYNATAVNYLVSSSLSLSGTFTIEGYVNWDGVGSNANMFTLGDSFQSTGIEVYISGGNWIVYSGNASRITGSAAVVGQWTYIAITRSGSTVTMYINGVSQGTWTSSTTFSGTIKVGAEFYNGVYYSSMSGYISNFRVNNTTAINAVPTVPLTAVSGTVFLTCQSNRFVDKSTNAYSITVNGTPSVQRFNPFGTATAYSTSVIGGSGYFDGSGDYLTVADNAAFEFGSGNLTIEGWMYVKDTGVHTLCSKATSSDVQEYEIYLASGTVQAYVSNGTSWQVTMATAAIIRANEWNHIAVTRSGSSWVIWVNGVSSATQTASFTIDNNTTALGIGAFPDAGFPTNGYISDFRIVKGTAVYTSAFTPPTAPLTAITNTSILTNFQNGAIFDSAMMNDLETVGNAQISTSVKKYGTGSIAFDGTGDTLKITPDVNVNMNFGTGPFTFECWIYRSSASGQIFIADFGVSSANGWALYDEGSGGNMQFRIADTDRIAVSPIPATTWTHLAVVRVGTTVTLYVNGTSAGSYASAGTDLIYAGTKYIGSQSGSSSFMNGYMDDIRITKGFARYTATFTPPTAAFFDTGPV